MRVGLFLHFSISLLVFSKYQGPLVKTSATLTPSKLQKWIPNGSKDATWEKWEKKQCFIHVAFTNYIFYFYNKSTLFRFRWVLLWTSQSRLTFLKLVFKKSWSFWSKCDLSIVRFCVVASLLYILLLFPLNIFNFLLPTRLNVFYNTLLLLLFAFFI